MTGRRRRIRRIQRYVPRTPNNDGDLAAVNRQLDRKVQQLQALIDFGQGLTGVVEAGEAAHRLGLTVSGQWMLRSWAVIAFREGRQPLVRQHGMTGLEALRRADLANLDEPFFVNAGAGGLEGRLAEAGAAAAVPLVSGDTPFGLLALGPRLTRRPYDDDDLRQASGLAAQAAVAFEAAWQAEEASHWRLQIEARDEWRKLDRLSRLAFIAVARCGVEKDVQPDDVAELLEEALRGTGFQLSAGRVGAAIDQLREMGALNFGSGETLRVEKSHWLTLSDARRPLAEIARDAFERIGAYQIQRRIGAGAMGEVYRAENVHDGSPAAIKLLDPGQSANEELRRRLEREGTIVASLDHPNIVRLLERGEHEGRLYLAMEYLEGIPLSERLKRGPLPVREALQAATALASALGQLHSRGVSHRDVKSSNVFLTESGRVVLLDFGLARVVSSTLTRSDAILGTVPYMAPELLLGDAADSRSDVWSLGIVFYEMLAGRRPWKGTNVLQLIAEIESGPPEIDDVITPLAGAGLSRVLADMLRTFPGERVADGTVAEERLGELL